MDRRGHPLRTALLVEPDASLAKIMEYALQDRRFLVTRVTSGSEALEFLRHVRPDSVILDPDSPDSAGEEMMEWLRRVDREASHRWVWIIISDMDEATFVKKFGRPLPLYFVKPFDPWDLVQLLEALLE